MTNRRLLDRTVTPEWMSTGLRIARLGKPWPEARQLLEVALRDEIESQTGRKKTATIIGGSWLKPAPEAADLVGWAREHASADIRVWHLGVLLANYAFLADVCAEIGRTLALSGTVETAALRNAMKASWGDRDAVNVATRSAIRTLRSFGLITGDEGDSKHAVGEQIAVEPDAVPWLIHALLNARGIEEIDFRDVSRAPEFFMFTLPSRRTNGYPHVERFSEGGGREVLAIVKHHRPAPSPTRQMTMEV